MRNNNITLPEQFQNSKEKLYMQYTFIVRLIHVSQMKFYLQNRDYY
jgi:hypothetical protein